MPVDNSQKNQDNEKASQEVGREKYAILLTHMWKAKQTRT